MDDEGDMTYFKSTELTKDKLPDDFIKSVKNINENTQEFLNKNPNFFDKITDESNTLMRGIQLKNKSTFLSDGLFSTSIREENASTFADMISIKKFDYTLDKIADTFQNSNKSLKASENHEKFLKDSLLISEHQKNMFIQNQQSTMGMILKFDINKLKDEKRIFAILTDKGLEHLKNK